MFIIWTSTLKNQKSNMTVRRVRQSEEAHPDAILEVLGWHNLDNLCHNHYTRTDLRIVVH